MMRFLSFAALAASMCYGGTYYQYSTTPGPSSTVAVHEGGHLAAFQVQPGFETITGMEFWNFWNATNNHAIEYVLWVDPTNDGNPFDAQVARTTSTIVFSPPAAGWQAESFAPITLNAGDWFFVGVYFSDPAFSYFLGNQSSTANTGQTFNFLRSSAGFVDLNNLGGTSTIDASTGQILIRAVADDPNEVPEPSTFVLLGGGLLVGATFRRRRRWEHK